MTTDAEVWRQMRDAATHAAGSTLLFDGAVVVVHSRWYDDDLLGRLTFELPPRTAWKSIRTRNRRRRAVDQQMRIVARRAARRSRRSAAR